MNRAFRWQLTFRSCCNQNERFFEALQDTINQLA